MVDGELADEDVVKLVLDGDSDAYRLLVDRYQKVIFNLMYRMCGSRQEAADLTQDVFVKAYEKLSTFQRNRKFFPWLYTIGVNHAKNFLRRRANSACSFDEWDRKTSSDYLGEEEDNICNRLDVKRIYQALHKLPLEYREAVVLRYHEGRSMQDIAESLGLNVSAAKMRVYRGIKKIRELLLEKEGAQHDK